MSSCKLLIVILTVLIVSEVTPQRGIFDAPIAKVLAIVYKWRAGASDAFGRVKAAADISAKAVKDAARAIVRGPKAAVSELESKHPEVLKRVIPSVDRMLVDYTSGTDKLMDSLIGKMSTFIGTINRDGPRLETMNQLKSYLESLDKVITEMIDPMIITKQSIVQSLNNIFVEFRKRLAKIVVKAIPNLCAIRNGPGFRSIFDIANEVSRNLFIVSQKLAVKGCIGGSCADLDIIISKIAESINCIDLSG